VFLLYRISFYAALCVSNNNNNNLPPAKITRRSMTQMQNRWRQ